VALGMRIGPTINGLSAEQLTPTRLEDKAKGKGKGK